MNYHLISFDLDGTLVDSAGEIAEAANRALAAHGVAPQPAATITQLIGAGTRELMLRLLARCLLEQPALAERARPEAVLASFDAQYALTTGTTARPYAGCHEMLARLSAGGLRLACVTNKESRHAHRLLAATGLDRCFELVVGGDSLAEKKPHASVLRHVLTTLGVAAGRCAHVGDSRIDIEAARNAGVDAWAVSHGYNGGVPIEQARPQQVFATLPAIADHVLAARPHVLPVVPTG